MEMKFVKLVVIFGFSLLTTSISAQIYTRIEDPYTQSEKVIKKYDINKDGYINREELKLKKADGLLNRFDKIDSDRNGLISRNELINMYTTQIANDRDKWSSQKKNVDYKPPKR